MKILHPATGGEAPRYERTAPVFEGHAIHLVIDSESPLSIQLAMITGDHWNAHDYEGDTMNGFTHKKSGLRFRIAN